jgi:hypothetical protein
MLINMAAQEGMFFASLGMLGVWGALIVATVALYAALFYLYTVNEDFRNSVNNVSSALTDNFLGAIVLLYGPLLLLGAPMIYIAKQWETATTQIADNAKKLGEWFLNNNPFGYMYMAWAAVVNAMINLWNRTVGGMGVDAMGIKFEIPEIPNVPGSMADIAISAGSTVADFVPAAARWLDRPENLGQITSQRENIQASDWARGAMDWLTTDHDPQATTRDDYGVMAGRIMLHNYIVLDGKIVAENVMDRLEDRRARR